MKKIIITTAILLLAAACNKPSTTVINYPPPQNQQATPTPVQNAGWQTYSNSRYGFSFQYPANYILGDANSVHSYIPAQSYFTSGGNVLVAASMPKDSYASSTDFQGAFFDVAVDPAITQADCQKSYEYGTSGKLLTDTQNINGTTFYKGEFGGAGAGNQGFDHFYHAYLNNLCYEVDLGLRTGGYGAAPSITSQVDSQDVFNKLGQILQTFKFTTATITNNMQGWKIYYDDYYGYSFYYPSYINVGQKAPNSVLGTAQQPVGGTYVGPLVFVVLDSPALKQKAQDYINGYFSQADHPAPANPDGPSLSCSRVAVESKDVQAVSCTGEGGPAFYAYVTGQSYDIFVDGYSRGFTYEFPGPDFKDQSEIISLLSYITFSP